MYTKKVAFQNLKGQPRNVEVQFNLFTREVFKLLVEFQAIFAWLERIDVTETIDLPAHEVVEYYNNFEEIILSAYGKVSEDGDSFTKSGMRYDFVDSACFAALMEECVKDTSVTSELIDGLMPKNMQEIVKAADANLAALAAKDGSSDQLQAEIEKLRAQLAEKEADQNA